MKITITTDRQPWANDRPLAKGETVDLSHEDAAVLIASGFAVAIDSPPTVTPVFEDDVSADDVSADDVSADDVSAIDSPPTVTPVFEDDVSADDVPEPAPAPRRRRTAVEGEAV